jgi:4-amino-4-deoxy-L-arabinose transferase-like glycosyltransferase
MRWFVWILLVAAGVRIAVLACAWNHGQRVLTPDSATYVQLSHSLAGELSFQIDDRPEINRTPGYPFFLAFSAAWGDSWWRAAAVAQVLLDVLLVHLTFLLGWMLLDNDRAGLIAAAFQAVSPLAVAASVRMLSDSVFAFMLTFSFLLVAYHLRSQRRWALLAGAVSLAAACYVRPVGIVFAGVVTVVLLLGLRRVTRAGLFVGIVAACLAPWVARNVITADFAGFSSFGGDSAYQFAVPELIAVNEGENPSEVRDELKGLDIRQNAARSPGEGARFRFRYALEAIGEHPWRYAGIHLKEGLGFFLPGSTDVLEVCGVTTGSRGTLDVLHKEGLLAAWRHYFADNVQAMVFAACTIGILALQYLGVVLCLVRRIGRSVPAEAWLLGLIVLTAALLPGPSGLPRYRIPVEPLLGVAAAAGLTRKRRTELTPRPCPG